MNKNEYNGWFNYETWLVSLWLSNESDTYAEINTMCADVDDIELNQAIIDVSHELESYIKDMNPLTESASMFSDLINAALSEVNWYEIAEHWINDYRSDNPQNEDETSYCRVCANEITDKNDAGDGYCSACYSMLPDAYDGDSDDDDESLQSWSYRYDLAHGTLYTCQTYEEWCADNPMVDRPALPTDL